MKLSRALAVLCAAALAPVALVVPAAHADQRYTGAVTSDDPVRVINQPDGVNDRCGGSGSRLSLSYDAVTYQAKVSGPHDFVLTAPGIIINNVAVYVLRNGACVAADNTSDDDAEAAAKTIDLTAVPLTQGEQITVQITMGSSTVEEGKGGWTLDIREPGRAKAPATGRATKYVALPDQVACATGTAQAGLTKKAKKAARKRQITSIVFSANGQKVAKVKAAKVRRAVKKGVTLKGIPKGAAAIRVVVKLKRGKKHTATRSYSAC